MPLQMSIDETYNVCVWGRGEGVGEGEGRWERGRGSGEGEECMEKPTHTPHILAVSLFTKSK